MRKSWSFAACLVVGASAGLWVMMRRSMSEPDEPRASDAPVEESRVTPRLLANWAPRVHAEEDVGPDVGPDAAHVETARGGAESLEAVDNERLDPESAAFARHVDVAIPHHLYGAAAGCDFGGLHRDKKLKVAFRVRATAGVLDVPEARVLESTLGDLTLENCVMNALRSARWEDAAMPDWTDDDEMVIRVRTVEKYRDVRPATSNDHDDREAKDGL